jgi:glycosyltransferase involved in cell wall biosynthesis
MVKPPAERASLRKLLGIRLGRLRMYAPRPLRASKAASVASSEPFDFAIVTPVRNQGRYIAQCVQSVLDQSYSRVNYLVKDGGSTDETATIVGGFASSGVRLLAGPDRGLAHALNTGFALVGGDLMAYLNGDDFLLPGTLHYVAAYFRDHPEIDVVYGHRIVVDEQGMDVGRWVLPPHSDRVLRWDDYVPQETTFWRRRIWNAAGACFDESFRFAVDWELWLRFLQHGARFARLPRYLGAFRTHELQKTATEMAHIGRQEIEALRRRHGRGTGLLARGMATAPYLFSHVVLGGVDRWFGLYD